MEIVILIIAGIAIGMSGWALYRVYDHEIFHNFITQPTVIKYSDLGMIAKQIGVYDLKQRVVKLEGDVSILKYESALDNMDVYDAIKSLKGIKNYVYLSEQEKAALNITIDEMSMLFGPKGESKDDK